MNYTYFVVTHNYDYFTGDHRELKGFKTLVEAWSFYKSNSKFDFDYGDHYQITNKPWRAKDADAYVLPEQRPHARSLEEYENCFSYKCEPVFVCKFDDIKDVEVAEEKEEEELFDKEFDLLF